MSENVYAFYKYSIFPYIIGGKILKWDTDSNLVYIDLFPEALIEYDFLLEEKFGIQLLNNIEKIEKFMRRQYSDIDKKAKDAIYWEISKAKQGIEDTYPPTQKYKCQR